MKIYYHIATDEDFYIEAFKKFSLSRSKKVRYLSIFIKILAICYFVFFIAKFLSQEAYALALLMFGLSLIVLSVDKIGQYVIKRNLRKSPHANEENIIYFSEDGFHSKSDNADTKLKWSTFTKFKRFDDGFLLFQGPKVFNWLPDTSLSDPTQLSVMETLLKKYV